MVRKTLAKIIQHLSCGSQVPASSRCDCNDNTGIKFRLKYSSCWSASLWRSSEGPKMILECAGLTARWKFHQLTKRCTFFQFINVHMVVSRFHRSNTIRQTKYVSYIRSYLGFACASVYALWMNRVKQDIYYQICHSLRPGLICSSQKIDKPLFYQLKSWSV